MRIFRIFAELNSKGMKRDIKFAIIAVLLTAAAHQPLQAKKDLVQQKKVYMMGIALSQNDSLAYITDLQPVDGVTIERKTKFLADRHLYSEQFKTHLEQRYQAGPYICAIYFGQKLKKMERRYLSLHKRYASSRIYRLVTEDQSQFRFKAEEFFNESTLTFVDETKAKEKKSKRKDDKSDKPKKPKKGERPGEDGGPGEPSMRHGAEAHQAWDR